MGFRSILVALTLIVVISGCRTYGGYGTEEETLRQIARANEAFADELERARNVGPILEQQVTEGDTGVSFNEKYQALLLAHETLLENNIVLAEEVTDDAGGYRNLNRVLGSMLSEQRIIRNRYKELLYDAYPTYRVAEVVPGDVLPEALYTVVPPFYERVANAGSKWPMTPPLSMDRAPGGIETEPEAPVGSPGDE